MPRAAPTLLLLAALATGCLERDLAKLDTSTSSSTGVGTSTTTHVASASTATDVHTVTGEGVDTTETSTSEQTTDATTASSTTTATTATTPVCGDGLVEGDEECDDPADLDESSCMSTCVRPRLAFLTSAQFFPSDLHGLGGADNHCRKAALDANLPDPENFKALLSDSTTSAEARLHHGRGPYRLVNGLQVARDWDALMQETLDNPLATTELGTQGYPGAWTGTKPGGEAVPGSQHCKDWSSDSFNDFGSYGRPTFIDSNWLMDVNDLTNPTPCAADLSLYCLEQE